MVDTLVVLAVFSADGPFFGAAVDKVVDALDVLAVFSADGPFFYAAVDKVVDVLDVLAVFSADGLFFGAAADCFLEAGFPVLVLLFTSSLKKSCSGCHCDKSLLIHIPRESH